MNKKIYIAALHDHRPNLLGVHLKKKTDKMFILDPDTPVEHIVGSDTPGFLHGRQLHKLNCHWRYTAQGGLELLRELMREDVHVKRHALAKATSDLGYVERFKLEEQDDD